MAFVGAGQVKRLQAGLTLGIEIRRLGGESMYFKACNDGRVNCLVLLKRCGGSTK